jgi:hypothetical protein
MAWPWHNPVIRCAELNAMSEAMWRRRSLSLFDKITVRFTDGQYVCVRHGHPEEYKFEKYRAAENWLAKFYDGLLYGSGAPDDIFMDALKGVSAGHRKAPVNRRI